MSFQTERFYLLSRQHQPQFHPVVAFDPGTELIGRIDLTTENSEVSEAIYTDLDKFTNYIEQLQKKANAVFLIGGYNELRGMYSRSTLFNAGTNDNFQFAEPRRLHLGVDIWGKAGTEVYAPLGGVVHSFAFNNRVGDYGATIILLHQLEGLAFHTLYGHLSMKDIEKLKEGDYIAIGHKLAHFGLPAENGQWPPHLHFQIIFDMQMQKGDYPGVCRNSEKNYYLTNCPDPDLILGMNKYLLKS
ncbi:MAG TPA: peptidoglycan DD-metalloendopeptidase family protein [Flavitalea sp.]|nr:peptidoglycan DD-metalloendopeptidase family protein [Flavitalea sp.]